MSKYDYKSKLDYRNNLFSDLNKYSSNPENLTMKEWYKVKKNFKKIIIVIYAISS